MSDRMERAVAISLILARKLRLMKGLKTQDIATACKIDRKTVSRWFSGKQDVSVHNLPILAGVLGCTVEELSRIEQDEHSSLPATASCEPGAGNIGESATATLVATAEEVIEIEIEDDGKPWTEDDDMNLLAAIRHVRATRKPYSIRLHSGE